MVSPLIWDLLGCVQGHAIFQRCTERVRREDIGNRAVERGRNSDLLAKLDDASRQPANLKRPAALQIVIHRRRHVPGHVVRQPQANFRVVFGQVYAVSPADHHDLTHDIVQESPGLGLFPDRADRDAHGRGRSRQADEEYELLPDLALDVGRQFGVDAALDAGGQEFFAPGRTRAVELAEQQPLHRTGLANDARTIDRGRDITDAAHDLGRIILGTQIVVFQHAVLKRDDRCFGTVSYTHLTLPTLYSV